jgi:hypothetical protein
VGESQDEVSTTQLPVNEVETIATAIDDVGLLCLTPTVRDGYKVFDLGRYSVTVLAAGYSKTVYVDECMTVSDTYAFSEIVNRITSLRPQLGERLSWGPHATSAMAGSGCN